MKILVFDAGPIISLATNSMLWVLKILKKRFDGEFYIPESIKYELIDRPIEGKKFKFEALHTLTYLRNRTLKVYKKHVREDTNKLAELINSIFRARGQYLAIVQLGEVETIAVALQIKADAVVIDERTMRLVIESPLVLQKILQKKMRTNIEINYKSLTQFNRLVKSLKVIRSVDIATRAFELGLFKNYIPHDMTAPKKELLTAILWALKLGGCSISQKEIDDVVSIESL